MHLKIKSPEKLLFDGDVYGIKATAKDGEVVCLNQHADYLTVLEKCDLVILDEKIKPVETFTLDREYILFIENNMAAVFS